MSTLSRRSAAAFAAALLLLPGLAACGDDSTEARTHTTHTRPQTTEAPDSSEPEVDPQVLAEVEQRGVPKLEATGPVDELKITDDVEGTGAAVTPQDTVVVHYVGAAATTGEEFDSSWERGEPLTFPLSGVIKGWTEGLTGMKVGGRRTLVIPAELAYGDSGPAPGDSLVFTVDLLAVQ